MKEGRKGMKGEERYERYVERWDSEKRCEHERKGGKEEKGIGNKGGWRRKGVKFV